MTLAELARITGGLIDPAGTDGGLLIDGPVVTDSREAGPGSLYVARIGEHADGHAFVPGAAAAGAVAALTTRSVDALPSVVVDDVQEAFAQLARALVDALPELVVIGVTGSSGKTTTKDLLAAVLAEHGPTIANVGSLNSEVGVPLTVCRITPDTRYLVQEMGARGAGHIEYLVRMTHPRIGVVLNVGSAHVGEFGSQAAITAAKAELLESLPVGGVAVLNADDPQVRAMPVPAGARTIWVGTGGAGGLGAVDAEVRATDIELDPQGAPGFTLHLAGQSVPVQMRLLGRHQVDNALAVAAVAAEVGMSPVAIASALGRAEPASRWRMERHERADGVTVLNDAYNANPESMAAALRTLAHLGRGGRRTWAVLGGMLELGPGAPQAHVRMGELAEQLGIREVLAVGSLARPIVEGAQSQATDSAGVNTRSRWVNDTDAALALLTAELRQGDVVLLKSSRDSGLRHLGDRLLCLAPVDGTAADGTPRMVEVES